MSTLDEQVVQLQEKVAEKKAKIAKAERPTWQTNLAFPLNGQDRIQNIQTITDVSTAVVLFAGLEAARLAFLAANEALGTKEKFTYGGFTYEQWQQDFTTKITVISLNKEKTKLRELETLLGSLESEELKKKKTLATVAAALEE